MEAGEIGRLIGGNFFWIALAIVAYYAGRKFWTNWKEKREELKKLEEN